MGYIVFARKWRPKTFDEIMGQDHITTTLKNAIEQNRVAHAYLFNGPRGTGKTTMARVLAKAINCKQGPTAKPCNKCIYCTEINEGRSLDLIEIDGASNRGIDEVRDLRESARFHPQKARFKVYIIDEVHMLTQEAFNALLKTLEEPPAHAKFVFATTAAHKVIPTISSRCQRFDFRRISAEDIISKLKRIAKEEGITVDEAAFFAIARAASGSMRDAESVLDQLNSFCKGNVTLDSVNSVLGLVRMDYLNEFADYIINKDTPAAIELIEKIISEGKDAGQFLTGLGEYFRNMLIVKQGKAAHKFVVLMPEEIESLSKKGEHLTVEDLLYIIYSIINTHISIRRFPAERIPLEMLAVKLTRRESIVSLTEIMERIAKLEKVIGETPDDLSLKSITEDMPEPKKQLIIDPEETKEATEQKQEGKKPDEPAKTTSPGETETHADLYRLREVWPRLIKDIKQEKIYIASCLSEAKLVSFKDSVLTLGFAKNNRFHKESLERAVNKRMIERKLSELMGATVVIDFIISDEYKSQTEEQKTQSQDTYSAKPKSSMKKVLSDPIIKSALDIFHGTIMKFW